MFSWQKEDMYIWDGMRMTKIWKNFIMTSLMPRTWRTGTSSTPHKLTWNLMSHRVYKYYPNNNCLDQDDPVHCDFNAVVTSLNAPFNQRFHWDELVFPVLLRKLQSLYPRHPLGVVLLTVFKAFWNDLGCSSGAISFLNVQTKENLRREMYVLGIYTSGWQQPAGTLPVAKQRSVLSEDPVPSCFTV